MEINDASVLPEPSVPEPEEPRLGFGAKLWNVFFDPRKTFASVGRGHEWVILWLIASAVAIGGYIPVKSIVKEAQIEQITEQLERTDVPEEKQAEIISGVEARFENPMMMLFVPGGQLVAILLVAGILLFIGNILLGGNSSYLRMMNAYGWAMMVVIPATIVTIPMVMAKGSMDVSLGLGVLTSPETGAFLKKLLSSFELFGLWQVWLSSVAVSVVAGVDSGKSFWAVFAIWFVWVLAQSGLATLGMQFGM